jgi:hypothetical protein
LAASLLALLRFGSSRLRACARACAARRAQIRLLYLTHNIAAAAALPPDRFRSFLRRADPLIDADASQRLFASADADRDGAVSPEEFETFCRTHPVSRLCPCMRASDEACRLRCAALGPHK